MKITRVSDTRDNTRVVGTRTLGAHLRIEKSYTEMLEFAERLGVSSCQFFFMPQGSDKYLRLTQKDKLSFLTHAEKMSGIYAHCSYWINPATGDATSAHVSRKMLKRELGIAHELGIEYLVVHGGSAKRFPAGTDYKQEGLRALAKLLNHVLRNEKDVTVLVENTAHAGKSICSDLEDFRQIRTLLTTSQVKFCIDTSHAFAYGYDLSDADAFVELLDQTMGLSNIALIHLNDSAKACGSKIDQHTVPGDGLIGKAVLQKVINHPKLCHLPLIIEPPVLSADEMKGMVQAVRGWC